MDDEWKKFATKLKNRSDYQRASSRNPTIPLLDWAFVGWQAAWELRQPVGEELVEAVAKAICQEMHGKHGQDQVKDAWAAWHSDFELFAEAAIPIAQAPLRDELRALRQQLERAEAALRKALVCIEAAGYLGSYDATVKGGGIEANTNRAIKLTADCYEEVEDMLVALSISDACIRIAEPLKAEAAQSDPARTASARCLTHTACPPPRTRS